MIEERNKALEREEALWREIILYYWTFLRRLEKEDFSSCLPPCIKPEGEAKEIALSLKEGVVFLEKLLFGNL